MQTLSWCFILRYPSCLIASGMGIGLFPKAPGTFASLLTLPFVWVWYVGGGSVTGLIALSGILFLIGAIACHRAGVIVGKSDHKGFVIDEIVAMAFILALLPYTWMAWSIGFLLFRYLDIQKPWPINWVDRRLQNGWGVMLDDLLAAGCTLLICFIIRTWMLII